MPVDVLDALLPSDPENADALKLREALPRVVADALRGAVERNDMDVCGATGRCGRQRLSRRCEDRRTRRRRAQAPTGSRRPNSSARPANSVSPRCCCKRPLDSSDAEAAANGNRIAARFCGERGRPLREADGRDPRRRRAWCRPSLEAGKASLAAIRAAASVLETSKALSAIYSPAEARIADLQKQRDAELAAQNGELVINALPWGTVDQVLDASRKPVGLPEDRTTPLRLTLPAGSYYVTLRHPRSSKTVSAFARVSAGKRSETSASFPTLSAEEYLKNAGL